MRPTIRFLRPNYPIVLFALFIVLWIGLAIAPTHRMDWFLENLLVFALLPLMVKTYRRNLLSNLSYSFIFVFSVLHIIGAHYTYSEVPWGKSISFWLGFERNHYDRLVHFLCGALLAQPLLEILQPKLSCTKRLLALVVVSTLVSIGAIYEIIEWIVARLVAPEAGTAYLGTQGDVWDAQKDLALKFCGALTAMSRHFLTRTPR